MTPDSRSKLRNRPLFDVTVALICGALLLPADPALLAQQAESPAITTTTPEEAPKIPNAQLDSLVAPIALYPDPLLSQTLVASTYPLEVIQLEQWLAKNKNLKDKALADAIAQQPWDPSIQGLAIFPDVVTRLAENVAWTSDLGNAFLAQQSDVMAAIQRMRAKARGTGNLQTSAQQKVETQEIEGGEVFLIEQADPEVVYIPSYDPEVVYGPALYPYPSYYYPGYARGMALAFGVGLVLGAAWGGGWGYGCGWGHGDININNNNNFINNYNRKNINNINRGPNGKWQHNPQHRGSVPYGNRQTANKYGGTARSPSSRPSTGAGNRFTGGTGPGTRPGGDRGPGNLSGGDRGPGSRPGAGDRGPGNRPAGDRGPGNRPGGDRGPGNRPGGDRGPGDRPGGGDRPSARPSTTFRSNSGGDRVGGRHVSPGSGFGSHSTTFGGGGFSGGSVRSASGRGGHSMGGGGFHGGGGHRGGGGRGGGGGRRR